MEFIVLKSQDERFAFSKDIQLDSVFASVKAKVHPQVKQFIVSASIFYPPSPPTQTFPLDQQELYSRRSRGRLVWVSGFEVIQVIKYEFSFAFSQVPLSSAVSHQILGEFRSLTDICDVLSSLDIAIGFLSSTGGSPDMLLNHYLQRVLRMPHQNSLRSLKV